ncbi:MAG: universal stress protein [Spirosomataceae bacterium]
MKTILVPTDFSENAQKALTFAEKASRYGATIGLIHAYHPPIVDASMRTETMLAMVEQAEIDLRRWQNGEMCQDRGFSCTIKLVYGAASDVVLDEIEAQSYDGSHGRTGKEVGLIS